jgi:hypothetical protein
MNPVGCFHVFEFKWMMILIFQDINRPRYQKVIGLGHIFFCDEGGEGGEGGELGEIIYLCAPL